MSHQLALSITFMLFQMFDKPDYVNHELHLARLEYELTQRKKLSELCSTFEDEKKQLATGILISVE